MVTEYGWRTRQICETVLDESLACGGLLSAAFKDAQKEQSDIKIQITERFIDTSQHPIDEKGISLAGIDSTTLAKTDLMLP